MKQIPIFFVQQPILKFNDIKIDRKRSYPYRFSAIGADNQVLNFSCVQGDGVCPCPNKFSFNPDGVILINIIHKIEFASI